MIRSNKRRFSSDIENGPNSLESPSSVGLKRRKVGGMSLGAPPPVLPMMHASNKRRRDEDGIVQVGSAQMVAIREEMEQMRREAQARILQQEVVQQNLQQACDNQRVELQRLDRENKLLKKSLLAFNEMRTESDSRNTHLENEVSFLRKRVQELEEANMRLVMKAQRDTFSFCRDNGPDNFPGGPPPAVF